MGVGDAVASAGPLQTISTSLQTDNHINTQWRQRKIKVGGTSLVSRLSACLTEAIGGVL